jgi:hypothetical protein
MPSIPAKLLYVFLFAVFWRIVLASLVTRRFAITVLLLSAPWPYALFDLFAGAFALWIQGGVIPVLVWAFLRFRRRSANTVLMCWAAVIAVLGFKDLYAVWFAFWVPTLR